MDDAEYARFAELVRAVRHDANNPLTAAIGHVQLLLEDPAVRDPDVLESLRVVETELRRLTGIIRRLAAVGMPEAPAGPPTEA